jgi:hypothetical protein
MIWYLVKHRGNLTFALMYVSYRESLIDSFCNRTYKCRAEAELVQYIEADSHPRNARVLTKTIIYYRVHKSALLAPALSVECSFHLHTLLL